MRPPLLRVLIGMLSVVLLGAFAPTAQAAPVPEVASVARGGVGVCPGHGEHRWLAPDDMARNFRQGDYCNAGGKRLPFWVYTKAKDWYKAHPDQAPGCAAPHSCTTTKSNRRGDGWDWGFISWLKNPLNTGRCLGWYFAPAKWVGCKSQPDWVHTVRRVEFWCGGTMVLVGALTGNPIAAFGGGATCAYGVLEHEFSGSWRQRR